MRFLDSIASRNSLLQGIPRLHFEHYRYLGKGDGSQEIDPIARLRRSAPPLLRLRWCSYFIAIPQRRTGEAEDIVDRDKGVKTAHHGDIEQCITSACLQGFSTALVAVESPHGMMREECSDSPSLTGPISLYFREEEIRDPGSATLFEASPRFRLTRTPEEQNSLTPASTLSTHGDPPPQVVLKGIGIVRRKAVRESVEPDRRGQFFSHLQSCPFTMTSLNSDQGSRVKSRNVKNPLNCTQIITEY